MLIGKPIESTQRINDLAIAVCEWPGNGPPILLCHATSFHARCWDQIVAGLPGRRCLALDFRGHGRSGKPAPPYPWRRFGEDLAVLAKALRLEDAIGVGHSMGGHSLALAAALAPGAFRALLLLDPVILPKEAYTGASEPLEFIRKRRNFWKSPQEMLERYATRSPFSNWDPAVLRDYCEYGLDGNKLCCPPEVEASIYSQGSAPESNIYSELAQVTARTHIVRSSLPYARGAFEGSPTAPDLWRSFPQATDEHLHKIKHFIPMEAPALTARLILNLS